MQAAKDCIDKESRELGVIPPNLQQLSIIERGLLHPVCKVFIRFYKMTQMFGKDIVVQAKSWAADVWKEATSTWAERPSQDHAYREHVVNPAISKVIQQLNLDKSSSVVETGCGDGAHTFFWRKELNSLDLESVRILGIDLLESLISKAKKYSVGHQNIDFAVCDITGKEAVKLIIDRVGNPDVIIAMFLLQDVPDLEGVLKTVTTVLKKNGHFIAVFVHPAFAMHLQQLGQLKVAAPDKDIPAEYISPSGIVQWRFRGYYPIAQADKPPFYVPYFHRSLKDYQDALKIAGLTVSENIPLMPAKSVIMELEKEHVLPFVQSEWNVYWPIIVSGPSSILIHSVKL